MFLNSLVMPIRNTIKCISKMPTGGKLATTCRNRINGWELNDVPQNAAAARRVCHSMTQLLKEESLYKYPGVWLDCKLSFQTHIEHLKSKIKSRVGFLYRNKASVTHAAKHTHVKLTILPILDFGNVIYKIASNTLFSKLDVVYHSAIRFVTKAPYTTHHCDLYALVGWPSLHIRRKNPLAPGHP